MPEQKYFIIGDLLVNIATGIITALFCAWLVTPDWSMLIAMVVAMIASMVLAMVLALAAFIRFFGAMEVMVPVMLSGMVSGMLVGMRAAMTELSYSDASLYGALCGLVVIGLCWAVNSQLRGEYTP